MNNREAFGKWFKSKYPSYGYNGEDGQGMEWMRIAFEAAKAQDAELIAELRDEIKDLKCVSNNRAKKWTMQEDEIANQAKLIAELVEALENIAKCGKERDESGMDWESIATSRSQYISKKNIIACKALAKVKERV